jgi:hypothetical protein
MLKALITDGPFKGWPLHGAMVLASGAMGVEQLRAALVADAVRRADEAKAEAEYWRSLPVVPTGVP